MTCVKGRALNKIIVKSSNGTILTCILTIGHTTFLIPRENMKGWNLSSMWFIWAKISLLLYMKSYSTTYTNHFFPMFVYLYVCYLSISLFVWLFVVLIKASSLKKRIVGESPKRLAGCQKSKSMTHWLVKAWSEQGYDIPGQSDRKPVPYANTWTLECK